MTHILAFALGLAAGVVVGLRMVYTQEPATTYREDDDGVQPVDPWLLKRWPYPVETGGSSWQMPPGWTIS